MRVFIPGSTAHTLKKHADPDLALHRGVSGIFNVNPMVSSMKSTTIVGRIKRFYTPTYEQVDKHGRLLPVRRYGNGRFRKWVFILLHIIIITLVLMAILVPIVYFVVIPGVIRSTVATADISALTVAYANVTGTSSNSIDMAVDASLPSPRKFPLTAKLSPMIMSIRNSDGQAELAKIKVPEITLSLKDVIHFAMAFNILVPSTSYAQIDAIFQKLSSEDGLDGVKMSVIAPLTISMWGITFYRDLEVRRDIEFPKLRNRLLDLMDQLPSSILIAPGT